MFGKFKSSEKQESGTNYFVALVLFWIPVSFRGTYDDKEEEGIGITIWEVYVDGVYLLCSKE